MKPSVGRIVWFWHEAHQAQPSAGIITYVHDDGTVNLTTFDQPGMVSRQLKVSILKRGDTRTANCAEWPTICDDDPPPVIEQDKKE